MALRAVKQVSVGQNGVGAFILQCRRIDFHYCDWAGSSKGMNKFLTHLLPTFARQNPQIEIHVSPRPSRHPCIRGHYIPSFPSSSSSSSSSHNPNSPNSSSSSSITTKERSIDCRNLEKEQILKKVEILRDAGGGPLRKIKGGRNVESRNEGVRGVWSGMHGGGEVVI